jgi:hypothetical protein
VVPYIATTSATRVPFWTSYSLASIWIGGRIAGAAWAIIIGAAAAAAIIDAVGPKLEDVAVAEARVLVDPLAVEDGAGRRPEVDDPDLIARHLDHRVHAGDRLVVEAEVAALELPDLDDVLIEGLGVDELVAVEDLDCEGLGGHVGVLGPALRGDRQPI